MARAKLFIFNEVLLFFVSLNASAGPAWTPRRCGDIEVWTNGQIERADAVMDRMQNTRALLSALLPVQKPRPLTVFVLSGETDWLPRSREVHQEGVYHYDGIRDWIVLREKALNLLSAASHEYTHYWTQMALGRLPAWLNEGMAEYFSNFSKTPEGFTVGARIERHAIAVAQQNPAARIKSKFASGSPDTYSRGWAIVHFLLSRSWDLPALRDAQTDVAVQLATAIGKPTGEAVVEFQRYVELGDYRTRQVKGGATERCAPGAGTPQLAEPEAFRDVILAVAGQRKGASAAEEAMERGDDRKARRELEREVARGSDDADVYYQLALLARDAGESGDYRSWLERALRVDSTHASSLYALANLLLQSGEKGEAHRLLVEFSKLKPDLPMAWEALAAAAKEAGELESAAAAAQRAHQLSHDEEDKRRTAALLEWVKPAEKQPAKPIATVAPGQAALATGEGVLEQVDCLGKRARLVIRMNGERVRLIVSELSSVRTLGLSELPCGETNLPVRVGFKRIVDQTYGSQGELRTIELLEGSKR